ncbi:MAG: YkgJ family cysteine cluster protein [Candidatus Bathyarchaeota archaeon]
MLMIVGEPVKRWHCEYSACKALCCKLKRELTLSDIKKITEVTGKKTSEFVTVATNHKGVVPFTLKKTKGKCVFLGKDYKCQIHKSDAKPTLCQIYPFLLQKILYGDEPIMVIKPAEDCSGIGKGPKFDEKTLKKIAENAQAYITEVRKIVRLKQQGLGAEDILKKHAK